LKAYPNPVSAGSLVSFSADINTVEVYDLSGKLIISSSEQSISTELLKQGIYSLRIIDADNKIHLQKLMVK